LEELRWWDELQGLENATSQDFVAAACRSYLHFLPGTRCEYCSLSFAILGELITRITGTPYAEYLREAIFAPLGMNDTAFQPTDRARGVPVYDFGGPEQVERFSAIAAPGGGMWSTAADLISFGQTFLTGGRRKGFRLLGRAAIRAMTSNQTPGMNEVLEGREVPFNYGLGWGKPALDGSVISSPAAYGHGGATGTYFWVDPEWDMVFVFLTNRWGIEHDTPRRILNAVYGALDVE
jgi:CubicO group peptidase (beta-lactamase class C family)